MASEATFKVGDRVRHKVVGQTGVIESISPNLLEVRRDNANGVTPLFIWSKLDAELIDEVDRAGDYMCSCGYLDKNCRRGTYLCKYDNGRDEGNQ